jgi:hypothetical protein
VAVNAVVAVIVTLAVRGEVPLTVGATVPPGASEKKPTVGVAV